MDNFLDRYYGFCPSWPHSHLKMEFISTGMGGGNPGWKLRVRLGHGKVKVHTCYLYRQVFIWSPRSRARGKVATG